MNIDSLSMSGHKFYGPKGIGVLYVREGIKFEKMQDGGHQERNKRAGTENVPAIVGVGKAIEIAYTNFDEKIKNLENLRNYCISRIKEKVPFIKINGDKNNHLPGNCNISFKNIDGEALLLNLDRIGICASSGSACNSDNQDISHVLDAIGLEREYAEGSLRITFGIENTKEDIDYLVENITEIVERLRDMN